MTENLIFCRVNIGSILPYRKLGGMTNNTTMGPSRGAEFHTELARSYSSKTRRHLWVLNPNSSFVSPPDSEIPTTLKGLNSPDKVVVDKPDDEREKTEVPVGRGEMAPQSSSSSSTLTVEGRDALMIADRPKTKRKPKTL